MSSQAESDFNWDLLANIPDELIQALGEFGLLKASKGMGALAAQHTIAIILGSGGEVSAKKVAEYTGVNHASVTNTINEAVAAGILVQIEPDSGSDETRPLGGQYKFFGATDKMTSSGRTYREIAVSVWQTSIRNEQSQPSDENVLSD